MQTTVTEQDFDYQFPRLFKFKQTLIDDQVVTTLNYLFIYIKLKRGFGVSDTLKSEKEK